VTTLDGLQPAPCPFVTPAGFESDGLKRIAFNTDRDIRTGGAGHMSRGTVKNQ
jgi:hypothetical protein